MFLRALIIGVSTLVLLSGTEAQSFFEGQLVYRFTDYEPSLAAAPEYLREALQRQMDSPKTVVVQDDKLGFSNESPDRPGSVRVVQDATANKAFSLFDMDSLMVYDTVANWEVVNWMNAIKGVYEISIAEDSVGGFGQNVLGFNCRYARYLCKNGDTLHFYLTNDLKISIPGLPTITGHRLLDTLTLVQVHRTSNGERLYTYGIDTIYNEVQNPEWLSTAVPDGAISREAYKQLRVDKPSIQARKTVKQDTYFQLKRSMIGAFSKDWVQNVEDWERQGILSGEAATDLREQIAAVPLDEESRLRGTVKRDRFKVLVQAWMLQRMLATEHTRQMIVSNLQHIGCFSMTPELEALGEAFVRKELTLADYLLGLPVLHGLPRQGEWVDVIEGMEVIWQVFNALLPEVADALRIDLTVLDDRVLYILRIGTRSYSVTFRELTEPGVFRTPQDKGTGNLLLNHRFYNGIIREARQIAADLGLNKSIELGNFYDCFFISHEQRNYEWLIAQAPELALFEHPYFLKVYETKEDRDKVCSIPISFPVNSEFESQQATLSRLGTTSPFTEQYYTTEAKRAFLDYIWKERVSLGLSKPMLSAAEKTLMNQLISDPEDLLKMIEGIYYIQPRSDERLFEGVQGDFKAQFPEIHRFLGGTFDAKNLRPGSAYGQLMLMENRSQTVEVRPVSPFLTRNTQALLRAIQPFLASQQMGIYILFDHSAHQPTFFRLTFEQKRVFERLLKVRLVKA